MLNFDLSWASDNGDLLFSRGRRQRAPAPSQPHDQEGKQATH